MMRLAQVLTGLELYLESGLKRKQQKGALYGAFKNQHGPARTLQSQGHGSGYPRGEAHNDRCREESADVVAKESLCLWQ